MKTNLLKVTVIGFVCLPMLFSNNIDTNANSIIGEQPVAGITISLDKYYDSTQNIQADSTEATTTLVSIQTKAEKEAEEKAAAEEKEKYNNIGIADVENYLNIREKASEDSSVIGKLPKDAGCYIYDIDKDGWAKIKSGKVSGYVQSSYLVMGDKVPALAKKVGSKVATVNTTTLYVREKPNTESTILTMVPIEEELDVIKQLDDWVYVYVDSDKGYVSSDYVNISYELKKAVSNVDIQEDASNGVSSTRASMVAFAKQFLGNSYRWGGTSLTNGTDCSGFTMQIYRHFGVSISRTSGAQSGNGTTIKASNARPGDLIFYSNGSRINHVAMCIGNGQVIHASNPRSGIKISNMYYRTPVKAVRILGD